mmetsp:Transcript_29755/g.73728  ORF Transcript_29755/g.73728 Transcript_29755/m.73728 type:complete len:149 (+) Transcript_29755:87-533(+)|eukprot:CAMPEP_0197596112 /NCGR_PEP_ID=MMETSP1326-20131121/24363_1 /TAXON_ID=1155430 /ORGANISM="Genus nov. species nov., Strain RCC2288" /LENGTH=148 /DNA_ID=CAMNT_0043162559 /DNA_START=91 /DNA_END=537 /DNA_ORIENTATION=+
MSKKNNKGTHRRAHAESMRKEKEDQVKKEATRAKKDEKDAEAAGAMMTDAAKSSGKKSRANVNKTNVVNGYRVKTDLLSKPASGGVGKGKNAKKNTHKIIKGVRVGVAQAKLKLRKGSMVRGIKITDADSRNAVLSELKAEAAMKMVE